MSKKNKGKRKVVDPESAAVQETAKDGATTGAQGSKPSSALSAPVVSPPAAVPTSGALAVRPARKTEPASHRSPTPPLLISRHK